MPAFRKRDLSLSLCYYSARCGLAAVLSQAQRTAQQVNPGRSPRKQAPPLLNGLIMAWIRRNAIVEPCY
ncbi:unnamed protein product [Gadus morhua 'NCC']